MERAGARDAVAAAADIAAESSKIEAALVAGGAASGKARGSTSQALDGQSRTRRPKTPTATALATATPLPPGTARGASTPVVGNGGTPGVAGGGGGGGVVTFTYNGVAIGATVSTPSVLVAGDGGGGVGAGGGGGDGGGVADPVAAYPPVPVSVVQDTLARGQHLRALLPCRTELQARVDRVAVVAGRVTALLPKLGLARAPPQPLPLRRASSAGSAVSGGGQSVLTSSSSSSSSSSLSVSVSPLLSPVVVLPAVGALSQGLDAFAGTVP